MGALFGKSEKLAVSPLITCEAELPTSTDTDHEGYPVFMDNCSIEAIFLAAQVTLNDDICSDPGILIQRTWMAMDISGNLSGSAGACVQTITIERAELTFPVDLTLDCSDYELADLTPAVTGEPFPAQATACMYSATYVDEVLQTCGGLSKIIRTWTVLDMCSGQILTLDANGNDNIQIIELIDNEAPVIDLVGLELNTDSDACSSSAFIELPFITDNCSGVDNIQIFVDGLGELDYVYDASGNITGGYIPAPGAELGSHTLTVTAMDACGNFSTASVGIMVEDHVTPTAVCDEITTIALGLDGTASIFAESIDDGSHDNCCLEGFDARRIDQAVFGTQVDFNCTDLGNTIGVILRVHDCHGNTNTCMVEVLVEDKINPYLAVPADLDLACTDFFGDIQAALDAGDAGVLDANFGLATYGDNCEVVLDYSYSYDVDQCGVGTINRTWTVTDGAGNGPVSGTQTISVYHVSDWSVSFPSDIEVTCAAGELPDFGSPTVIADNCELIAISFEDTQYDVVDDACYKIVREWTAINWCAYPDETGFTGTQVIKVIDNEAPIFDVDDFVFEITESDCDTYVQIPLPDVLDCSSDITIETTSNLPAGEAGPGSYTIYYTVSDGCGNYAYDVATVTVVDAKKPTPYLTDALVVEIMQTGMIGINVYDFDLGSYDNCSEVVLSFSPDVTDTDRVFDCNDLGDNVLEIWVTDMSGNQDFATVTLTVQDNMNVCGPGSLTVAGAIATPQDEIVEDVLVEVNGGIFDTTTDASGNYSLDLPAGGDYSVAPYSDDNLLQGVTTFDIVIITKHILGLDLFDSAYQMIAADVNNSQSVTTLDAVAIRKAILQLIDYFPNNTSWRFVDKNHVFTDIYNPWGYPEVINYNNLAQDQLMTDFTAVKIGDVNGSYEAFNEGVQERTGDSYIEIDEMMLQKGDLVSVPFYLNELMEGFQFTLNFDQDNVSFSRLEEGLLKLEHMGLAKLDEGALTFSWNGEPSSVIGNTLFTLDLIVDESCVLSDVLSVNSRFTSAEAYPAIGGIHNIGLFAGETIAVANKLYQNIPNPVKGSTTIGFELAENQSINLSIMTLDGQIVKTINGDFHLGYNEVVVKDLNSAGVLYYTLRAGDFTSTKKMIIIE